MKKKKKKKAKAKAKMGRPRIEVDWEQFDKLCAIQATLVEISAWFNCCEDTIEARVQEKHGVTFSEYYKSKSAVGKMSLRRQMFKAANAGNITMQIWLSKQYLGMRDKTENIEDKTIRYEGYSLDEIEKEKDDLERQIKELTSESE